jgi:hypothetical protein
MDLEEGSIFALLALPYLVLLIVLVLLATRTKEGREDDVMDMGRAERYAGKEEIKV